MQLDELPLGKSASITKVGGQGALRQHFLDMGLLPGAEVQLVKYAPSGDPMEIRVQSYELSLRKADAAQISITGVHTDLDGDLSRQPHRYIDHPRLGEDSPYAPRKCANWFPNTGTGTMKENLSSSTRPKICSTRKRFLAGSGNSGGPYTSRSRNRPPVSVSTDVFPTGRTPMFSGFIRREDSWQSFAT